MAKNSFVAEVTFKQSHPSIEIDIAVVKKHVFLKFIECKIVRYFNQSM